MYVSEKYALLEYRATNTPCGTNCKNIVFSYTIIAQYRCAVVVLNFVVLMSDRISSQFLARRQPGPVRLICKVIRGQTDSKTTCWFSSNDYHWIGFPFLWLFTLPISYHKLANHCWIQLMWIENQQYQGSIVCGYSHQ